MDPYTWYLILGRRRRGRRRRMEKEEEELKEEVVCLSGSFSYEKNKGGSDRIE